jgi:cyanophycinase-like exopeptidase
MRKIFVSLCVLLTTALYGQTYTSYLTGNTNDIVTAAKGGVCLMGGATEHDSAMVWFLKQCNGGDVLVLRATGTNGYNTYLYSGLGISVNSVETIVCHSSASASDPYVLQKVSMAEGIWFAGGDQWDYISYWRNTKLDSIIRSRVKQNHIVLGGISAGMAIQGGTYYTAQNGSITSSNALANPFNSTLTIDSSRFLSNRYLENVITDTHYDNPDRRGRHITFMARMLNDWGILSKGIACDEYTAVCIDTTGIAKVYGEFPAYDDNAYFLQTNCENTNPYPENCTSGVPLTWNHSGAAVKVYKIKGDLNANNYFDLNNWTNASGGVWENWSVLNGVLSTQNSAAINCNINSIGDKNKTEMFLFPNPAGSYFSVSVTDKTTIVVMEMNGKITLQTEINKEENRVLLPCELSEGIYLVKISSNFESSYHRLIISKY